MARGHIERRTIVFFLSLLLLASGTPQVLARDAAQDAFLADALAARQERRIDDASQSFGVPPDDEPSRLATIPTASGANPLYPANHTLDAIPPETLGTPPVNHDVESPGYPVGQPPTNYDLEAASIPTGTPPTNHDFATGDLTGWTTTGSVTIQSDATHGSYAQLSGSGPTLTSDPFTVDPSSQTLAVELGFLASSGGDEVTLAILSGPGYSTVTALHASWCGGCATWVTRTIGIGAWLGQTIKLRVTGVSGTVGIDAVRTEITFPGYTVSGSVSPVVEADGNRFAQLAKDGVLTTAAFTADATAQFVAIKAIDSKSPGGQFFLDVLSGPTFATATRVHINSNVPDIWTKIQVNTSQWLGQQIKLQVTWQRAAFGVDDLGTQSVEIPDWQVAGDAWLEPATQPGASGYVVSTNGDLTSAPFVIDTAAQHLTLAYQATGANIFYVKLLRGPTFSEVVDLSGNVSGTATWQTLTVGIQPYAGETVKLRIDQYFGRGRYDNVGVQERLLPGWTLATTTGITTGEDSHGTWVQSLRVPAFLQSVDLATGIIDRPSVDLRYYAISYDIGHRSGEMVRVYWFNRSTGQNWIVFQDAANAPTGYRTRYFYVADYMGTDGYFKVQVPDAGKLYSIADNVARQHLNEPFSDTIGVGIDTTTGAFGYERQDASTVGVLPLTFTRYYAGPADRVGTFGWRWSHTYDTRLEIQADGDIGVIFGSGREEFFDWFTGILDPPNRYIPVDARVHDTLVKNGDGTYTFTTTANLAYLFSATGRLESISDLNGNSVTLIYDGTGRLTTVTDPDGRELSLTYTATGQIETLTAPWTTTQDAVTTYTYDSNGDLVQVTDPDGGIEAYAYVGHRLTEVQRSEPGQTTASVLTTVLSNRYDQIGRVIEQTDAASQTIQIDYDTPAKGATRVTDPALNSATYYFDRYARTTDKVDPLGHVRSSTYDAAGNLQSVIDETGEAWDFQYDANGNRTREEDPLGNPVSYLYNPLNLPAEITDARNNTTTNTYDALGNLIEQEDPLGGITTYTYDSRGRVTSAENPLQQTETWAYDPVSGTLTTWTDRRGNDWTYEYDAAGRMTKETNPLNQSTIYEYNFFGHLTLIRDPLNHEYRFTYDLWGNLVTHRDPMNNVTTWGYDERADVVSRTDADGKVWTYTYDANHNMTSMTDPLNRTTTWGWDDANRLISETDALSHTTSWTYDAAGRLATATDPMNRVTGYGYDDSGRLTSRTLPGGFVWTYTYDPNGNLLTETNPRNYTTTYAYDALNRLTSMTDALSGVVSFGYDAVGNMTSLTDAQGKTRTYTYDANSNLLTQTDPLSRTANWTYDDAGQLLTRTDPRGVTVTYGYDASGNLTSEIYPGGSVTYGYDADDRRTTMTDPTGTTTWTYDDLSRVTAVAAPQGTVGYAYDAAGQRTSMTLPGNRTIGYSYDNNGNLASLTDWQSRTIGFSHNAANQRTGITRPNGVSTNFGYDAGGRLDAVTHANGGTTLQSYNYTLDANGNRTSVTTLAGTETYTLDALDRLTSVSYTNGDVVGYTYDAQGNRLTQVVNGVTTNTYTYDNAGQLTSDGVQSYTYDAAGNQLTAGSDTFTWDWKSRLTSASVGGTTVTYAYDGTDVRVGETTAGLTTDYVWDRAGALPYLVDDGTTSYVHADGILAELDGTGTPTYPLTDALGSVRGTSDLSGTLVGTADYGVFGSVRAQTGAAGVFGFTGEQLDIETGFVYLRARQYDPEMGRFVSADSMQPGGSGTQGFSLYAYAGNSPCTVTDPSGHYWGSKADECIAHGLLLLTTGVSVLLFAISKIANRYGHLAIAMVGLILISIAITILLQCAVEAIQRALGGSSDASEPSSNSPDSTPESSDSPSTPEVNTPSLNRPDPIQLPPSAAPAPSD